jgi:hypothetical protein
MWETRRLRTLWASTACYRNSFTYHVARNQEASTYILDTRNLLPVNWGPWHKLHVLFPEAAMLAVTASDIFSKKRQSTTKAPPSKSTLPPACQITSLQYVWTANILQDTKHFPSLGLKYQQSFHFSYLAPSCVSLQYVNAWIKFLWHAKYTGPGR